MNRRRILFITLALAAIGVLGWLVFFPQEPPDPIYAGQPLSYWLLPKPAPPPAPAPVPPGPPRLSVPPVLGLGFVVLNIAPEPNRSVEAVRQLGTNSIPTLLRLLRAREFSWKPKLVALAQKQHFVEIKYVPAAAQNSAAASGFVALGADASNAVPALVKIFEGNYSAVSQRATLIALAAIGPAAEQAVPALLRHVANRKSPIRFEALDAVAAIHAHSEIVVPVLIACLQDPAPRARSGAANALVHFAPDARPAVPALIACLADPVSTVQGNANVALRQIGPDAALPALIAALADPNPLVRDNAGHGLSMFGAEGKPAIPALLNALNDQNDKVRLTAAFALKRIDPDTAAKALPNNPAAARK